MRRLAWSLILAPLAIVIACSEDGGVAGGFGPDGSDAAMPSRGPTETPIEASAADAAADGPSKICSVAAPFTSFERVGDLDSTADVNGLALSADLLDAYVGASDDEAGVRRFVRPSVDAGFDVGAPLGGMPAGPNMHPSMTPEDEGELFFSSGAPARIFVGYVRLDGSFENARTIPGLADAGANDDHPFMANGSALYFARRSVADGPRRIHVSSRANFAVAFVAGAPVEGLGTLPSETNPVVTSDETAIYFATPVLTPDGGPTSTSRIMRATRSTWSAPFGAPAEVTEITAGGGSNRPAWLSADRCTLYFLSTRAATGPADHAVWVARRAL